MQQRVLPRLSLTVDRCCQQEFFPNVGLFNASMELSDELAQQLEVERPVAVSTRDVPFWSRAALPLLAKRGIIGTAHSSKERRRPLFW